MDGNRRGAGWLWNVQAARIGRGLLAAIGVAIVIEGVGLRTAPVYGQVFTPPTGRVENVSFEAAGGGVINVYYDLVSDSATGVFSVTLQASDDGGKTFSLTPSAISGDVAAVRPGRRKKIVWQSGQDVAILPGSNLLKFNVIATAGDFKPAGTAGAPDGQKPADAAAAAKEGGSKLKYILPIAGGGAVAAAAVAAKSGSKSSSPPPACGFAVSPNSLSFAFGGEAKTVNITVTPANCSPASWTVSGPSFVTFSPTSGTGNGQVTITATSNNAGARTGSVTIQGQTVAISQDAAPPPACTAVTASPNPLIVGAAGGASPTVTIGFAPDGCQPTNWTASVGTNPGTFITNLTPASGGAGSTFGFTAQANSGAARNGTIVVKAGSLSFTLDVSQSAAAACQYQVTVNNPNPNANQQSVVVSVATQSTCRWSGSFSTNPGSFLAFNNMSSDGGKTTTVITGSFTNLMVSVAQNNTGASRVGQVKITDANNSSAGGSVTITQAK